MGHRAGTGSPCPGTPDGKTAYVTSASSATVTPIRVAANRALTPIPVGVIGPPGGGVSDVIAITPDGRTAYVADAEGDAVFAIRTATSTATIVPGVADDPVAIAITSNGQTAYVANTGRPDDPADTVATIRTATNTPGPAITVGAFPMAVTLTPCR